MHLSLAGWALVCGALMACASLKTAPNGPAESAAEPVILTDASSHETTRDLPEASPDKTEPRDADVPMAEVRILATGQVKIHSLYTDGREVFFTLEDGKASIRAVKPDGSALRTVAPFDINEGFNPFVGELAAFEGKLAWTSVSGGLFVIDKQGLDRRRRVSTEGEYPLATDATSAVFVAHGSNRSLISLSVGADFPVVLATYVIRPLSIALDAERVFWSERGPSGLAKGGIKSIARTPGLETEASVLYREGPDWDGGSIALTSTDVFFAEPAKQRVVKVSKVGGAALVVAESLPRPVAVAVRGTELFILDNGMGKADGALYRMPIGPGAARPSRIASGLGQPTSLLVDETNVYIACTGSGELASLRYLP